MEALWRTIAYISSFCALVLATWWISAVAMQWRFKGRSAAPDQAPQLILVIAHPDDETMFFLPTLLSWPPESRTVICLSNGNYQGLGQTRRTELERALNVLGGYARLEFGSFKDGPKERWDESTIASFLAGVITDSSLLKSAALVTFDQHGVSGHINHVATYHGVASFAQNHPPKSLLFLKSPHITVKFTGTLGALAVALTQPRSLVTVSTNVIINIRAMQAHASQFVWFRRLFVMFYIGSFVNTFHP